MSDKFIRISALVIIAYAENLFLKSTFGGISLIKSKSGDVITSSPQRVLVFGLFVRTCTFFPASAISSVIER